MPYSSHPLTVDRIPGARLDLDPIIIANMGGTAALDLVWTRFFIASTGGTDGLGLWMEVANVPWTGAGLAACAVERPRRTPDDSAVELALVVLPRLRRMFNVNDRWFVTGKKATTLRTDG